MAETQIGMAKFNLDCMSTDGCTGGFTRSQRELFLDAKSRTVLEQIEMDASIRASGIDNIETCPFCPFAAVSCLNLTSKKRPEFDLLRRLTSRIDRNTLILKWTESSAVSTKIAEL